MAGIRHSSRIMSQAARIASLLLVLAGGAHAAPAVQPLRISLIGGNGEPAAQAQEALAGLGGSLARGDAGECTVLMLQGDGAGADLPRALNGSDVAVFWVSGRPIGEAGRAALLGFASAGKGLVVLGASGGAWADWAEFEPLMLGAHFGAIFADGAPMRVINLFPHPIFSGIRHFETPQGMRQCELAPDAQIIMEGTVGENTVPMGWVRRYGKSRIVSLEPGGSAMLGDPDYRALVLNSVRWAGFRPIPGARTLIQRTYMRGAYPGALAINFPEGPSVCYDTVRGGIDYIWDGDFVDLHPWWTARHGVPLRNFAARFSGRLLYPEAALAPAMHVGEKGGQSDYHFRGYRLKGDGFPELYHTVGGREITEDLHAVGDGVGVERSFHVAPGASPLWLRMDPDTGADVSIAGAAWDGNFLRFDAAAGGDFTVTIREKAGLPPSR